MTPKVFISYRRDDSSGHAGRVHDRLEHEFGRDLLFMDVDSIPLGTNFIKVLREEVAKCDVLLAVIGPNWLSARDEDGNRRLDSPSDFVRIEISTALQRGIPVIPILLDGSKIPKSNQLPSDLEELSVRNGLDVRHASFHFDMDKLIKGLKQTPVRGEAAAGQSPQAPDPQRAIKERASEAISANQGATRAEQQPTKGLSSKPVLLIGGSVMAAVIAAAGTSLLLTRSNEVPANRDRSTAPASPGATVPKAITPAPPAKPDAGTGGASSAAASEPNDSAGYVARARIYLDEKDYDRAISDYGRAIALDSKNALAFYFRGIAYRSKGNADAAISDCSQAIALLPKYTDAYVVRGNVYGDKKDYDRAIADYNQAIAIEPNDALAYTNRGIAFAAKGDADHAFADFSQAITFDPKLALAYKNRAKIYRDRGDYDRSIADYGQAIALDSRDSFAYYNRAIAYRSKGDRPAALADCNQAIALSPKFVDAFVVRGNVYDDMKDYDHAIADYSQAIAIDPRDALAYNNRARTNKSKGDFDRAAADFDQSGFTYLKLASPDAAIGSFSAALQLQPGLATSLYGRGLAKRAKGDVAGADSDVAAAKAIRPGIAEDMARNGVK